MTGLLISLLRICPQHPHSLHDFLVPILCPHGLSPMVPSPCYPRLSIPDVQTCLDSLSTLRSDLLAAQTLATNHGPLLHPCALYVGDKVWLEGKNISTLAPSLKLTPRRYGPFPILSQLMTSLSASIFPSVWWARLHLVFHASLCRLIVKPLPWPQLLPTFSRPC